MELFADKYYELDCTKKMVYHSLLFGTTVAHPGHTLTDTPDIGEFATSEVLIVFGTNVQGINLTKADGTFCYSTMIATNVKKFILE